MNTQTTIWTPATVRAELPPVKIKWHGKLWWARVTGRACEFASVSPEYLANGSKYANVIIGPCIPFAWSTIANALNNGRALRGE